MGVGFYGPSVFLHTLHEARGWSVSVLSAAITCHFLFGACVVVWLPVLHRRLGSVTAARVGGIAAAVGVFGWAFAVSPWQLFITTLLSGAGWADWRGSDQCNGIALV